MENGGRRREIVLLTHLAASPHSALHSPFSLLTQVVKFILQEAGSSDAKMVRLPYLYSSNVPVRRRTIMTLKKIFLLFLPLLFPLFLYCQDTVTYKVQINYKKEEIINNKRYRVYDNWVNFGAGYAYHSKNPRTQFTIGLDFNFHIKQVYFNMGGFVSGDGYGQWNSYQAHLGYVPYRRKTEKYHMAAIAAISYTNSREYLYAGHYFSQPDNDVGFYAAFQVIRKIEYTDGIGLNFFCDVNKRNVIAGVRIEGYLSGAYKGYVKGKEPHSQFQ